MTETRGEESATIVSLEAHRDAQKPAAPNGDSRTPVAIAAEAAVVAADRLADFVTTGSLRSQDTAATALQHIIRESLQVLAAATNEERPPSGGESLVSGVAGQATVTYLAVGAIGSTMNLLALAEAGDKATSMAAKIALASLVDGLRDPDTLEIRDFDGYGHDDLDALLADQSEEY